MNYVGGSGGLMVMSSTDLKRPHAHACTHTQCTLTPLQFMTLVTKILASSGHVTIPFSVCTHGYVLYHAWGDFFIKSPRLAANSLNFFANLASDRTSHKGN